MSESASEMTGVGGGGGGLPGYAEAAGHFALGSERVMLNHGSFGSVPRVVREEQARVRALMDAEPVGFFVERLEPMLDAARARMAAFVGCDAEGFAFVENATAGVNAVVRSLRLEAGDELLTSAQEYNACNNVLRLAAERWGARVVEAPVPFPLPRNADEADDAVVGAILSRVTGRTRLALVSHVTSPTAVILPVERIVRELGARGVETLVDGAHAPGYLPLEVERIGAAYYTGNFHKWLCAPQGSAFLHVREDRRAGVQPTIVSHGMNSTRTARSRFRLEFDYIGSMDYSAWLATPGALECVAALGGAQGSGDGELRAGVWKHAAANRTRALRVRAMLAERLGRRWPECRELPVPEYMIGSMAAVRLPDRRAGERMTMNRYHDPLQERLLERWGVQVPVIPFPMPPERWLRLSVQVYNSDEQYEYLARALEAELGG